MAMDRRLVLELVRVTEAAAIACFPQVGRGDKMLADEVAVEAMRSAFDRVPVRGTVVIGEGEMDEAPMLYIGEQVGPADEGLPQVDIAVDPLEGTNLCAKGRSGAIAVLAVAERGNLLHAPDIYMAKIATGPEGRGVVSLAQSPTENVRALARAKGVSPSDITVVCLDRERHAELIAELRATGARMFLITDGDVAPAVAACVEGTGIDMLYGIGGAPEGVLGAAAAHCLGGEFKAQLQMEDEEDRQRCLDMGLADPEAHLDMEQLVRGEVLFVATGVTSGPLLKGVTRIGGRLHLHSLALRQSTGTIRYVESQVVAGRFA
jgi:fructose-1,6-bisphosphatase II